MKEAAETAAYRVADAESKSYLAAEAVKEAEKISLLVEHSDSMLQIAKDIYEQCTIDRLSFLPIICDFFNLLIFKTTIDLVGLFMQVPVVKLSSWPKMVNEKGL